MSRGLGRIERAVKANLTRGAAPDVDKLACIAYGLANGQQATRSQGECVRRALRRLKALDARQPPRVRAAENHRARGTGDFEWFTPERWVAAARAVMGGIDLDPATHARAQQMIQAKLCFTRADNGLMQEWHGRVWLNPPYTQPDIARFVDKLVTELLAGRTIQAILLTHNYSDTAWFHTAARNANALCFPRGRIAFVDDAGEPCAPTQGQTFFYFGAEVARFCDAFRRLDGFVLATS
jgi:ParB family chromosome partitioning protein